ncbi:FMN-linked oxidoreductase [Mytilinidion resinicola]|uniref:FMN-linked oxidoreductase n=1 Tax=Mytilinidion resinicola TaxID=574789 RepID=A0A6A6YL44_9PEZI|nr:FMN-linked oxidoreductase [Mytilinidion resinicola]KAF2808694.1 FMN-linked oxidoreductase [Mytilinidion resinicola]
MSSKLFEPLKLGSLSLKNRLVLAPLTRFRAADDHVHQSIAEEYYAQRGSVPGTLLITEATFISARAGGYPNVPGLWSKEQLAAWKKITDAVHAKGSYIFVQLWALGRAANPQVLEKEGAGPLVSSSDVPLSEDAPKPQPLTESEIQEYIQDYARAAKAAVEEAGFDGVEVHGANGYLIDQFTQDTANKRTDKWGGSIENRARFGLEVAKAVVAAIGSERTGIRLSPFSVFQGMRMDDPIPQFSYLVKGLKELKLTYLHLVESRISGNADVESSDHLDPLIDIWSNTSPVLLAGGFSASSAKKAVDEEYKDRDVAIVFGRLFISNPDLVFRIQNGIELSPYDREDFYRVKSAHGYTDLPFSKEFLELKSKV